VPSALSPSALSARNPLPEGTLAVGAGLLVSGVSSYVFLKLVRAGLGSAEATEPVNQLWFLTFLLAPGFFLPVEQEVGRALAHRRAVGQGGGPVVKRGAMLALGLAGITTVALVAAGPTLVSQLFHDSWGLLVCLVIAFLAWASGHLTRGVLSGSGRFAPYGLLLGVDGLLRVAAAVALTVGGVKSVAAWGLAVALPPGFAVLIALRGQRGLLTPGPTAEWSEITPNLGWLVAGSVLAAVLVNGGPVMAGLLKTKEQSALVSHFTYGVIITRIPLFLFQAVQAALLPKLAQLAARGALDEFRSGFRKLVEVVAAVGTLGVIGALAVGTQAVKVFSADADLSRRTVGLLALASALYMLGLAMAQAVIALHGHARVAIGWAASVVVFFAVAALWGHDLLLRVEMGLVLGSAAAVVAFAWAYRSLSHQHALRAGALEPQLGDAATLGAPLPYDEA
jgi:O-antigen/teichoic acid export membrane protein